MSRVIIALDFNSFDEVKVFLEKFSGKEKPFVKVGMELFYSQGLSIIDYLKERDYNIFLDLKLHDIPNTVYKSMKTLASLKVDIVNVHASGGTVMMKKAMDGLKDGSICGFVPKCIGVTQLTSTSKEVLKDELLIDKNMEDVVLHYAKNAKDSGLDGVVCSSFEVPFIKKSLGKDFLTITPGIRLKEDEKGDQVRVVTPVDARNLGSDFIVVGRSITSSKDPQACYIKIKGEFENGL